MPQTVPAPQELEAILRYGGFAGLQVLEIGAGDGRLTAPLAGSAALWLAVDVDADELALAGEAARRALPNTHVAVNDARRLCVPARSFDVVFFTWSLCCVPQKSTALAEASRVLKPGGRVLAIHPLGEAPLLQVWWTEPDALQRVPIGYLQPRPAGTCNVSAATDALMDIADSPGWRLLGAHPFDYPFSFETLDELLDFLDDAHAEGADITETLMQKTLHTLQTAAGPARLMVMQRTLVVGLQKA